MSLWIDCGGQRAIRSIAGTLVRVVEYQEQVATNQLVDTLDEQALLEQLLEDNKPPRPDGCARLHYLLATPFRYPHCGTDHGSAPGTNPVCFTGLWASPPPWPKPPIIDACSGPA